MASDPLYYGVLTYYWGFGAQSIKRMRKLSLQVQDTMGDVNHVVQESISGNAVVKSFAGEDSEQERFISRLKRI